MKNINLTFCFKTKIFKLYYLGIFACFQSFLSFEELQSRLGDHKKHVYLFKINKFWNKHYPSFYCSHVNTYAIYLKHNVFIHLSSLLLNTDLIVFCLLLNNCFYNSSYFQRLHSQEFNASCHFLINAFIGVQVSTVIFQLQRVLLSFLFLFTIKKN